MALFPRHRYILHLVHTAYQEQDHGKGNDKHSYGSSPSLETVEELLLCKGSKGTILSMVNEFFSAEGPQIVFLIYVSSTDDALMLNKKKKKKKKEEKEEDESRFRTECVSGSSALGYLACTFEATRALVPPCHSNRNGNGGRDRRWLQIWKRRAGLVVDETKWSGTELTFGMAGMRSHAAVLRELCLPLIRSQAIDGDMDRMGETWRQVRESGGMGYANELEMMEDSILFLPDHVLDVDTVACSNESNDSNVDGGSTPSTSKSTSTSIDRCASVMKGWYNQIQHYRIRSQKKWENGRHSWNLTNEIAYWRTRHRVLNAWYDQLSSSPRSSMIAMVREQAIKTKTRGSIRGGIQFDTTSCCSSPVLRFWEEEVMGRLVKDREEVTLVEFHLGMLQTCLVDLHDDDPETVYVAYCGIFGVFKTLLQKSTTFSNSSNISNLFTKLNNTISLSYHQKLQSNIPFWSRETNKVKESLEWIVEVNESFRKSLRKLKDDCLMELGEDRCLAVKDEIVFGRLDEWRKRSDCMLVVMGVVRQFECLGECGMVFGMKACTDRFWNEFDSFGRHCPDPFDFNLEFGKKLDAWNSEVLGLEREVCRVIGANLNSCRSLEGLMKDLSPTLLLLEADVTTASTKNSNVKIKLAEEWAKRIQREVRTLASYYERYKECPEVGMRDKAFGGSFESRALAWSKELVRRLVVVEDAVKRGMGSAEFRTVLGSDGSSCTMKKLRLALCEYRHRLES